MSALRFLPAFTMLVACSTSPAPTETTQPPALVPTSKNALDPLDVLPSKAGELQIKRAWRVSAAGVDSVTGQYEWEGTGATVTLSCSFPSSDKPPCDKSVPTRMKFGKVPACGSSKDEDGTGPLIAWRSCMLQIDGAGLEIPKRFERLKAAAAEAVSWTEKIFASTLANVDMYAVLQNRGAGLLAATRAGNVQNNLNISHQLDVGR